MDMHGSIPRLRDSVLPLLEINDVPLVSKDQIPSFS